MPDAGPAEDAPRPIRRRHREATRQRILDTAEELFATQGYESVTTKELAKQAGVATGALYHHFASKEAIYAAVVQRAVAARAGLPDHLTDKAGDSEQRLLDVTVWFVRTILLDESFRLLLGRELLNPQASPTRLLDPETFSESLAVTQGLIAEVAPEADADLATSSLFALIYGFSNLSGIYEVYPSTRAAMATPEQIATHCVELVLNGIRPRA